MQTLIKEGKYKVIDYLSSDDNYSSAIAVDIEDNEHRKVLINSYLNALDIRRLVPIFFDVSKSGVEDFVEYYTEYGKVNVVFRYHVGKKLALVFDKKNAMEKLKRLEMEEALLHEAVCMSSMPQELLCAALRTENAVVSLESGRLKFNLCARAENLVRTEWLLDQLSDMSELIFKRRFIMLACELDFLDELRTGGFDNVTAVYSAWRELRPAIESGYEALKKAGGVAALLSAVKTHLARRKRAGQYKRLYRERRAQRGDLDK